MVRRYNDEAYQRLTKQIDKINDETMCGFTDMLGDLVLHMGKWSGIIQTSNSERYQKEMLDMNNTTKNQLKKMFENAHKEDLRYSKKIKEIEERQKYYIDKLKVMSDLIKPGMKISSSEIRQSCSNINEKLRRSDQTVKKNYVKWLKEAENEVAKESLQNIVGDVAGGAIIIGTAPARWLGALYTKGIEGMGVEVIKDTWGLINDVYSLGSHMGALATVGIGKITGDNINMRQTALENAEAYKDVEGFADAIDANGEGGAVISTIKEVAQTADSVSAVTDIVDGVSNIFDKDSWEQILYTKRSPIDMKDMQKEYKTSYEIYRNAQDIYNLFDEQSCKISNLGNVYSLVSNIINEQNFIKGAEKTVIKKVKIYDELKSIVDLGDDKGLVMQVH
mgnify:FL=1